MRRCGRGLRKGSLVRLHRAHRRPHQRWRTPAERVRAGCCQLRVPEHMHAEAASTPTGVLDVLVVVAGPTMKQIHSIWPSEDLRPLGESSRGGRSQRGDLQPRPRLRHPCNHMGLAHSRCLWMLLGTGGERGTLVDVICVEWAYGYRGTTLPSSWGSASVVSPMSNGWVPRSASDPGRSATITLRSSCSMAILTRAASDAYPL